MAAAKSNIATLIALQFCFLLMKIEAKCMPDLHGNRARAAQATYETFTYGSMPSNRYATPLESPLAILTPYAPHFEQASTLLDDGIAYTTYSLDYDATSTDDGKYGQSAYASLWASEDVTYTESPPFTTTVSPTPVSKSELVFPPPLPVIPQDAIDVADLMVPSDFVWGVASSAWQIEGGLQVEGRGPSILDALGTPAGEGDAEQPGVSGLNDSNVNDLFYYYYKQDIKRLAAIGMPYLSFSIPWTRIVPFGVKDSPINTQGLDHYEDLINEAIENGITPIVTLLHFDLPTGVAIGQANFTDHFMYYAKQIMTRFGDRVPYWVTVNEPNLSVGYEYTNVLIAHATLYEWYKNELQGKGQITMKFANNLAVPKNANDPADVAAAFRYQDFLLGIMNNPLFLGEQYPETVLSTADIPIDPLTRSQLELISNKIDFFSFDPYTAQLVSAPPDGIEACASNSSHPLWPNCVVISNVASDGWLIGDASFEMFNFIAPQYVRDQFKYVWDTFKPSGIMVGEFGFPAVGDQDKSLDVQRYDLERTIYYQAFLTEMLKAVHLDGVNVIGTLAWSFMETNEFGTFESHFGLQTVNRTSFERSYKRSMFDYVDFFHRHVEKSDQ